MKGKVKIILACMLLLVPAVVLGTCIYVILGVIDREYIIAFGVVAVSLACFAGAMFLLEP